MLVDDEPEVLDSMVKTIDWAGDGFEPPVGCRDGEEAIAKLKNGYIPNVLITDINMPKLSGLALTKYVRENHEGILVIILSGYDEFSYAQEAIKLQVHDYILKPVTPAQIRQLLAALRTSLRNAELSCKDGGAQNSREDFLSRLLTGDCKDSAAAAQAAGGQAAKSQPSAGAAVANAKSQPSAGGAAANAKPQAAAAAAAAPGAQALSAAGGAAAGDRGQALAGGAAAQDAAHAKTQSAAGAGQLEENLKRHGLNFNGAYHVVALLDMEKEPILGKEQEQAIERQRESLRELAEELFENDRMFVIAREKKGRTYLIASGDTPDIAMAAAKSAAAVIVRSARARIGRAASAGIGKATGSPRLLYMSAGEAQEALDDMFYHGSGNILAAGEYPPPSGAKFDFFSFEQAFERAVQQLDYKAALEALSAMFEQIKNAKLPILQCAKNCQTLITQMLRFAAGLVGEKECKEMHDSWERQDLFSALSLSEMLSITYSFCESAFEAIDLACGDPGAQLVRKAENFIVRNYTNPKFSLGMVTNHIAVSTSYFSAQFKLRTGLTFIEYLTNIRMDKAKQLLSLTDWPTYEIAECVGFSSQHYFSVTFKRMMGMTPKEYRDRDRDKTPDKDQGAGNDSAKAKAKAKGAGMDKDRGAGMEKDQGAGQGKGQRARGGQYVP
jgi:two-component system response regulator YesN